jgi:hypothetical protein
MNTRHAEIRAQQRGIPPLIDQWLDLFGEKEYDGHGGVVRFFSRASIRTMKRAFGDAPMRKLTKYFRAYKVESNHDGHIITIGHRIKRINRR